MKQIICLILIWALLICFPGCGNSDEDTVMFYYLREKFTLGAQDSVVAPEARDISGRRDDLTYLLRLYLEGPLDDALVSPFPEGTRLISANMEDTVLVLELSETFAASDGIALTLSASCLASTCFDLTDAETVEITVNSSTGKTSLTLHRNSLTLVDESAVAPGPAPYGGE